MTLDLFLHPAEPADFEVVAERLRALLGDTISREHSTPEQLVLVDPDTAVYATLTSGEPPPEEEGGDAPEDEGVLHLQLPLLRPRFFAEQGAEWALAIAKELSARIDDGEGPRDPDRARLIERWVDEDRLARGELQPEDEPLVIVEPAPLAAIFAWNRGRSARRPEEPDNLRLPGLFLAGQPPTVCCRYTAGDKVWLPDAAQKVLLTRKKKGWLGWKDEHVVVDAAALRAAMGRFEKPEGVPSGARGFFPPVDGADEVFTGLPSEPIAGYEPLDWRFVVDRA